MRHASIALGVVINPRSFYDITHYAKQAEPVSDRVMLFVILVG